MTAYKNYKSARTEWLDDIPEHWNVKRLKFVAKVQPSNVDKKSLEDEIPVTLCNYVDVYKNEFIDEALNFMDATATEAEIAKFSLEIGDVLATKDSETADDIANSALVRFQRETLLCGYHLTQIRPDREELLGEYLFRLLGEHKFRGQFEVGANGVTRFALGVDEFTSAYIPLPPIPEQSAIANYLDRKTEEIDKLIANKRKVIELLKEERTAIINQTVTKGINPNVKFKPSGIDWLGEIPEHWQTKRLKYVAKIFRGKFTHRPRNDERLYEGQYPFIQTGEVARANKYLTEYSQTLNDEGYKVTTEFPKGTLLMTIAANIGEVAILDFNACFPDSIVGFYPFDFLDNEFLYYGLKSMKQVFLSTSVLNTQLNLNIDRISGIFIPFPEKKEQELIVEFIENLTGEIDSTESTVLREIELLQEYKTALISEVVTGKIKVC